jgi:hypothetical protein
MLLRQPEDGNTPHRVDEGSPYGVSASPETEARNRLEYEDSGRAPRA